MEYLEKDDNTLGKITDNEFLKVSYIFNIILYILLAVSFPVSNLLSYYNMIF